MHLSMFLHIRYGQVVQHPRGKGRITGVITHGNQICFTDGLCFQMAAHASHGMRNPNILVVALKDME